MKLSVMTYRASSERLNLLRQSSYSTSLNLNQTRRGSSLDSWLLSTSTPARRTPVYRKAYSDRLTSPPPPRRARVVSFDVSDDEDEDDYDESIEEDDADDEVRLRSRLIHFSCKCFYQFSYRPIEITWGGKWHILHTNFNVWIRFDSSSISGMVPNAFITLSKMVLLSPGTV